MKVGEAVGAQSMPVPAGMYPVEVAFSVLQDQVIKQKNNGDMQFSMPMKVMGGDYDGQVLWANFTLTQKAIWVFGTFLQQIGYDSNDDFGDPFEQDEAFMDFLGSLDGMRFQVEVTLEQVMSQKHNKMIDVNKVINYFPQGNETMEAASKIMGAKPVAKGTIPGAKTASKPAAAPARPSAPPAGPKAAPRASGPAKPGAKGPAKKTEDLPDWAKGPVGGDPIDGEAPEATGEESPF